jgi:hypothetical protein
MKLRKAMLSVALLPALLGPAIADEAKSGPKAGFTVSKFEVQDVTGPNKPNTLCYV